MLNRVECDVPKEKAQRVTTDEMTTFAKAWGELGKLPGKHVSRASLPPPKTPPGAVSVKSSEKVAFSGPPGSWPPGDGASDHSSSFTSRLMGLCATLHQQSINTIDLHVPGTAVLLGRRGSWLHFCIKGSD